VRSSYRAAEVFLRSLLRGKDGAASDDAHVEATLASRLEHARREAARVSAELGGAGSMEIPLDAPLDAHKIPLDVRDRDARLVPASSLVRR